MLIVIIIDYFLGSNLYNTGGADAANTRKL